MKNYHKKFHDLKLSFLMVCFLIIQTILSQTSDFQDQTIKIRFDQQVESLLALGIQFSAKNLSISELEKIPMVSSAIAKEIYSGISNNKQENPEILTNQERLIRIKGIGKVKAEKIDSLLRLD